MQVTAVLAPLDCVILGDLSTALITLIATNDDFAPGHVNAGALHFLLPVHEWLERITIVNIINHDYAISIFIELSSDEFVFFIAGEIKEIDWDWVFTNWQLFHTVIDSNRRNIPLYETTFTIALDQTWFTDFRIAHWSNFETNMRCFWGICKIFTWWCVGGRRALSLTRRLLILLAFSFLGRFWSTWSVIFKSFYQVTFFKAVVAPDAQLIEKLHDFFRAEGFQVIWNINVGLASWLLSSRLAPFLRFFLAAAVSWWLTLLHWFDALSIFPAIPF